MASNPRTRLRLSQGRDPKPCLATRAKTGILAVNVCCGGAGLHRAACLEFRTAERNGVKAVAAAQAAVALDAMREATGVAG